MAGLTNYLANKMLDHALRGHVSESEYERPSQVYLALHTGNPGDTGSENEVSGGAYARQIVTFAESAEGVIENSNVPLFTMPACTVSYFSVWDASTGGNCLFYDIIASPQTFNTSDTFSPQAGAVTISKIGS